MKTLTAFLFGMIILGSVMAYSTKGASKERKELKRLLTTRGKSVEQHIMAILDYLGAVLTKILQVIVKGLDTPGNMNLVMLAMSIKNRALDFIELSVECTAHVVGAILKHVLPPNFAQLLALFLKSQ